MYNFIRKGLETSYGRKIIKGDESFKSVAIAVLGLNLKYEPVTGDEDEASGKIVTDQTSQGDLKSYNRNWDKNWYNKAEQVLFLIPRVAKNIIKLATEVVWNIATEGLLELADKTDADILKAFIFSVAAITWTLGTIGQNITSPFNAIKGTYSYFAGENPGVARKLFAGTMAALRGLVTVAIYAGIAAFAAPLVAIPLATSGSVGAQIVAGLSTAVNFLGNLPVIHAIGVGIATATGAIASTLGTSLVLGAASAAIIAGAAVIITPAVAALKAVLRKLSPPWNKKEASKEASSEVIDGIPIPIPMTNTDSVLYSHFHKNDPRRRASSITVDPNPSLAIVEASQNALNAQTENNQQPVNHAEEREETIRSFQM